MGLCDTDRGVTRCALKHSKVGEVRKFPPKNVFFFPSRNFHFGTPKQISVVSQSDKHKNKQTNKALLPFSYLPPSILSFAHFHTFPSSILSFPPLLFFFYKFPSFPLYFSLFPCLSFPFPPLFPLPSLFSPFPLPSTIFP